MSALLAPFRIEVDDAVLADLRTRLARTRFPTTEPEGRAWRYGTSLAYLREVVDHWRDAYEWRLWESRLNAFPQYRVQLGGQRIHVLIEPGSGDAPLPLLMTHGWPGSIVEFLDIIEPLAHPERFGGDAADAFTVILPSIPGFGFSDPPPGPIHPREVAAMWRTLMVDVLGCDRYVAQGGDWGSAVSSWLALDHPERLAALHLNMVALRPTLEGGRPLDEAEKRWLAASRKRRDGELAYQQIQGTKPQTLAYGLTDSPAGLAAWILEKFQVWTFVDSDAPPPFDVDLLLTNIMLYWINGINAANWMYCSSVAGNSTTVALDERVTVPTGVLLFPDDLSLPPPDSWIERSYNLARRRDMPSGGHFGAMQKGEAFVDDVRAFFRDYR